MAARLLTLVASACALPATALTLHAAAQTQLLSPATLRQPASAENKLNLHSPCQGNSAPRNSGGSTNSAGSRSSAKSPGKVLFFPSPGKVSSPGCDISGFEAGGCPCENSLVIVEKRIDSSKCSNAYPSSSNSKERISGDDGAAHQAQLLHHRELHRMARAGTGLGFGQVDRPVEHREADVAALGQVGIERGREVLGGGGAGVADFATRRSS